MQNQHENLQTEFSRINPKFLEVQQQLDTEKRLSKQREDELIECKRVQLEMLNAEVERYNLFVSSSTFSLKIDVFPSRRATVRKGSQTSLQSDPLQNPSTAPDTNSMDGSPQADRRTPVVNPAAAFFGGLKRMFVPVATNPANIKLNQKFSFCVAASVPKREIYRWVMTFRRSFSSN